jgi:hypothetical protein
VTKEYAYIINFEPTRWPAGNPETGYLNTDGSPTKTEILNRNRKQDSTLWKLAFGKRSAEELYDLKIDPYCLNNLANVNSFNEIKEELKNKLIKNLTVQKDPRMTDPHTPIFDSYPYADKNTQNFHERWSRGEKINTGWVNPTDFEKNAK